MTRKISAKAPMSDPTMRSGFISTFALITSDDLHSNPWIACNPLP